jgi:RNA polymerase sigma-70 factor (ECF subfamily)
MERLRAGDDEAAREVFDRFARRLVGLARGRFNRRLGRRVDPEDVVQSAFKSFFVRHRRGMIPLGDWDGLWRMLTLITLRKCADRVEYFRAGRRDERRDATAVAGQDSPWEAALDREPRPDEALVLAEMIEGLFRAASEEDRPVLELSLEGYTAAEISLRLGRALRSVQRLREQIRRRLERHAREGLEIGT